MGAVAGEPDFEYEYDIAFRINRSKDNYVLSSETTVRKVFLTERSLSDDVWIFTSMATSPISNLKAWHNGKTDRRAVHHQLAPAEPGFLYDDRIYTFIPSKSLKQGDEFVVNYSQSYIDMAYTPIIEIPNVNAVKSFVISFSHPQEIKIEPEIYFPRGDLPYRIEYPFHKETRLTFDSLPYQKSIPYFEFNNRIAFVLFTITADTVLLTPTTPGSFVAWYMDQLTPMPVLDSVSLTKFNDRLEAASDADLFASINAFIQERIRYISDNTELHDIIPHDPNLILAREYGDCKDRAYLAAAMAQSQGRKIWMAPIATEIYPSFSRVHYSLWNHVICAYKDDTGYHLFDPTAEFHRFGDIPSGLYDRLLLVLNEDDPQLLVAEATDTVPSILFAIVGHPDSLSVMTATIVMRKGAAAWARKLKRDLNEIELAAQLGLYLNAILTQIGIRSVIWKGESGDEVQLTAVADLSHFAAVLPDRVYLSLSPFSFPDGDIMLRETDTLPLHFNSFLHVGFVLALAATGLSTEPRSCNLGTKPDFYFSSSLEQPHLDSVVMHAELTRYPKKFAGKARKKFMDTCLAYFKEKKSLYILKGPRQ